MAEFNHIDSEVIWSTLPDDCLCCIFQKLKNFSDRNAFGLTCQRWLEIQNSARTSLTFHFSLKQNDYNPYATYLPRLLNRFPKLSCISLAGCADLPDSALTQLRDSGSTLRCLSLYCCLGITDYGLSTVSCGCPYLTSITLYRCNVTDMGLEYLAKCCPALENINISYCVLISDRGINAISRDCHNINAVIISYCRGITGTGFRGCSRTLAHLEADSCALTPEGLLGVVSGGGLEYLNLSSLKSWLDKDGLDCIGAGLASRLRYLNLRMCRFVGDSSVTSISIGCPLLEEWNLVVCHEVRVAGWEAIGSNCRSLKVLHVNRCRNLCNMGLQALQDGCPQLKVMYMHGCRRVSLQAVENFKIFRQNVELKRDECVDVGPPLDRLFPC